MSRDGSGNYTLPVGNPVVSGTIIDVNWANPTMADIAQQLNNVVTRDGALGPLVPIPMPDGTQALPGVSFKLAPGTGLWREAAKAGYSYNGVAAWYKDSTGLVIPSDITVNSVNSGPLAGFKNRIANGAFDRWQRGTSFAAPANMTYTVDRWAFYNGSIVGRTVSRQAGFLGARYCVRLQRDAGNATSGAIGIFQPIEASECYALQGKTCILTFSARAGANLSGSANGIVYSGTAADQGAVQHWFGWTGQTTVGIVSFTPITTAAEYSCLVTVPANCLELGLLIYFQANGTAGAADYMEVTNVRLEPGSVPVPFENRPYQIEDQLCKRYGFRLNDSSVAYATLAFGYGSTTTACTIFVSVSVELRVRPSSVVFTAAGFELVDPVTGATQVVTAISIPSYTSGRLTLYCSVASGITVGKMYNLRQANNTAAVIDIFTEL